MGLEVKLGPPCDLIQDIGERRVLDRDAQRLPFDLEAEDVRMSPFLSRKADARSQQDHSAKQNRDHRAAHPGSLPASHSQRARLPIPPECLQLPERLLAGRVATSAFPFCTGPCTHIGYDKSVLIESL